MVDTWEGYFVVWSLRLPLGYPLEYPNPGAVIDSLFGSLNGMILGVYLVNTLESLLI